MKKVLFAVILACLLVLSLAVGLSACGKGKDDLSKYLGTDKELSAKTPTEDSYFVYTPVTTDGGQEGYEISLNPELSENELSAVEEWVIPGSYSGKPVVQIAENAFAEYEAPGDENGDPSAKVYVQPGVERVCSGGLYPARGSSFALIQLPSTCKVLEEKAVYTNDFRAGTGLAVIKEGNLLSFSGPVCFPDSLEYCSMSMEVYSGTDRATVENGVSYVGNPNNPHMIAFEYKSTAESIVLHKDCKILLKDLFSGYDWTDKQIPELPANLTQIGANAFKKMDASVLDIPDSVKYIENLAFDQCEIGSVDLPDSAVYVATDAFGDAAATLTGTTEYGRCDYLGTSSNPYFYLLRANAYEDLDPETDTQGYIIHENTKFIAKDAFLNAMLVWDHADSLQDEEMMKEALSVTVPDGIVAIGEKALFSTDHYLRSVSLPGNWPYLHDDESAAKDSAKPLYYFTGVLCTTISTLTEGRGETSVIIRDGYTTVEEGAFEGLGYLDELVLPASVTSISADAFGSSSTTVYTLTAPLIPAEQQYDACVTAEFFNSSEAKHLVLVGVTEIPENAFRYCRDLESITFPASLTSIGRNAFTDSNKVTKVTFLGTQAAWEAVEKGSSWLSSTSYEMAYGAQ